MFNWLWLHEMAACGGGSGMYVAMVVAMWFWQLNYGGS